MATTVEEESVLGGSNPECTSWVGRDTFNKFQLRSDNNLIIVHFRGIYKVGPGLKADGVRGLVKVSRSE